ncbi:MAG: N-acetylmuramoyl-L-alanine amidase, partial [Verrucomicrobia bacterium]|nr:N-acetylmuramoyl-L-alanine amidase [Verrucomicrobiota bacterium]
PKPPEPQVPPAIAEKPVTALSLLAENPDWTTLEAYQHTISRSDFEKLLTEIFTTDDTWREFIVIGDESAEIITSADPAEPRFVLHFATPENTLPTPRVWQNTAALPIPPEGKPLSNLHIAIDPGHIGGEWAKIEERWFQIGEAKPIAEGDMTLRVAKLLKPLLEELGATVTLVRTTTEPVTQLRPENLTSLAAENATDDPDTLRKFAERLFYRTAEIRARADLVNQSIKPDLVLCLHFNAEAWGDPLNPTLIPHTHFHILLNGGYTPDEVRLADQRFALLKKLLQRTHEEVVLVGKTVAETFAEISKLPAYTYPPGGSNVRPVASSPFLYARNLLANRLYDCPVVFMEPYVMNSTHDYARMQAGDYEGLREINGQQIPSIFREYADALAKGLAKHYAR